MHARGIDAPVRIGVPASAGIKTRLLGAAGPNALVDALARGIGPEHGAVRCGAVRLHFYPFGGLARTVEWINDYRKGRA